MKRLTLFLLLSLPLIALGQVATIKPVRFTIIQTVPDEPPIGCVELYRSFNPRTRLMSYYGCVTPKGDTLLIKDSNVHHVVYNKRK